MGLPPLAQVSDVRVRLPATMSPDPAQISALLDDVSAKIRNFTGQDFTLTQTTRRTRPIGNRIRLPQRPVVSVDHVAVQLPGATTPVAFSGWWWDGLDEIRLLDSGQIINLGEDVADAVQEGTLVFFVTETHGYEEIPDAVVGVACSMTTRMLSAPGGSGVISETVGEYSYRLSDTAAQGPMTLTESEKEILRSYQVKSRSLELRG
jgi:hypothetical protein